MLSLRRWTAGQLFGVWAAYWAFLVASFLARPALLVGRIRALPPGHAQANLGFGDGGLDGRILIDGVTAWHAHTSYGAMMFWIIVPPLLLWLAWVAVHPRPESPPPESPHPPPRELGTGYAGDRVAYGRDTEREAHRR
jgi:hypothetical protein